jgi:DNA-directed RNA polymerase specialized sigma24 family protein
VARNVLKESWEAAARQPAAINALRPHAMAIDPERQRQQDWDRRQHERRLECLERCLQDLSAEHRELIAAYYQGETSVKISNRKELAVRLGIPMNALRIRALRIRERLEACVVGCMERR